MKSKLIFLVTLLLIGLTEISKAQIKGMYVEVFGNYILQNADPTLKTKLVKYAKDHSFNYLILYDIGGTILTREVLITGTSLSTSQIALRDFISYAKSQITGLKIGVVDGIHNNSGGTNRFFENVIWYNSVVNDVNKSIDVVQLEYEYWNRGTEAQNNTAFLAYIDLLEDIDLWAAATSNPHLLVETYLGHMNTTFDGGNGTSVQQQADLIDPLVDRVLLHCYMQSNFMQDRIDV